MENFSAKVRFSTGTRDCSAVLPAVWKFTSDKRGYEMMVHLDLFEGFWLDRRWWGLMNNRGSRKRNQFLSLPSALAFCETLVQRRVRHGYKLESAPAIEWATPSAAQATLGKRMAGTHVTAKTLSRMPKKEAPREIACNPMKAEERQMALL